MLVQTRSLVCGRSHAMQTFDEFDQGRMCRLALATTTYAYLEKHCTTSSGGVCTRGSLELTAGCAPEFLVVLLKDRATGNADASRDSRHPMGSWRPSTLVASSRADGSIGPADGRSGKRLLIVVLPESSATACYVPSCQTPDRAFSHLVYWM